jgi:hypothetical protein
MPSSKEILERRRWYPARLLLPHEQRKPLWFHLLEGAAVILPVPLFLVGSFIAARRRYWRYHHARSPAAASAPIVQAASPGPAPAAAQSVAAPAPTNAAASGAAHRDAVPPPQDKLS